MSNRFKDLNLFGMERHMTVAKWSQKWHSSYRDCTCKMLSSVECGAVEVTLKKSLIILAHAGLEYLQLGSLK